MCLGILSACGVDPVVALRLRNAADYRLPTLWSTRHQTRAFLFSVNNENLIYWLVRQQSEKGDLSGHF